MAVDRINEVAVRRGSTVYIYMLLVLEASVDKKVTGLRDTNASSSAKAYRHTERKTFLAFLVSSTLSGGGRGRKVPAAFSSETVKATTIKLGTLTN